MSFLEGLQMSRKMPGDTAILLIDIDGFHLINTRYGHAGGDKVLRSVAALLQRVLKDALQIARVGGDVFAVRMVTNRRVLVLAERMRAAIESSRAEIGKHRVRLTVSVFGVTSADLGPHSDAIRLYNTVYALRAQHKSRPPNRTWWAGRSTATAQPEEKVLAFPREVNGANAGNSQSKQSVQFFGSGPPVTTE
jgi:diguanylate cyclase (GGDEF)-like protein